MSENNYGIGSKGYRLEFCEDGVFLIITPLSESGIIVNVDDVLNYLDKKQISGYDCDRITEIVEIADGSSQKIAEAQEEYKIDASTMIKISNDKMKASIEITPPDGGKMLSCEEMIKVLHEGNVVFGLDTDTIDAICRHPVFDQEIAIAKGVEPVHGKDGKMQYHFELSKSRTPRLLEDGRVDFHELNLIENVRAGDVLITAIPPTPGEPGKNVLGEELPPIPGKPVILPKGKNVDISDDGHQLIASTDGQVEIVNHKVNVCELYEVKGNVDNSVGNIDFVGNVVVRGNVLTGFAIEAGGTVEVQGVVEGATIKAAGDIILRRGMQGLNKGVLITEGDIVAKYIEHSNITAKGDVKSEAIMHSRVRCGGKLILSGKKGLIVGGLVRVWQEISAKMIGSPMATVTELEVGIDPELRERYKELKDELVKVESEIKKADQAVQLLKKLEGLNKLDEQKKQLLVKSIKTKVLLTNNFMEMKKEFVNLEEKLEEEGSGKVKVLDVIYPGTKVTIGSPMMYIRENIQYATLYRDEADIKIGAYEK